MPSQGICGGEGGVTKFDWAVAAKVKLERVLPSAQHKGDNRGKQILAGIEIKGEFKTDGFQER